MLDNAENIDTIVKCLLVSIDPSLSQKSISFDILAILLTL